MGAAGNSKDLPSERLEVTVDTDNIASRVVAVPVDEGRYYSLAAVKGVLVWLRSWLSGVLGEGAADGFQVRAVEAEAEGAVERERERVRRVGRGAGSLLVGPRPSRGRPATPR